MVARDAMGDHLYGKYAIQWLDDTMLFAKTASEYLNVLDSYLQRIAELRLRIAVKKTDLWAHSIDYCGRRITPEGWNFLPKYYETVAKMNRPTFVHELAKVTHLAGWLSKAIPSFAAIRSKIVEKFVKK